jgi:hypothetical protein
MKYTRYILLWSRFFHLPNHKHEYIDSGLWESHRPETMAAGLVNRIRKYYFGFLYVVDRKYIPQLPHAREEQ